MPLDLDTIIAACRPGGASVLTVTTELAPAEGGHGGVAPARFVRGKDQATYAFETRYIGEGDEARAQRVVILDSKGSSLNRVEAALSQALEDDAEALKTLPRVRLTYPGRPPQHDYDLPHRVFDGHLRAGTVDGERTTAHPDYVAARNATAANARALLELSPVSLVFGAWDSTRKSHQVRFRSCLVGGTIGVLADQSERADQIDPRGGARVDAIAPSVRLDGGDLTEVLDQQRDELSAKNIGDIEAEIKKAKGKPVSAAKLGLGNIPPSLSGLGLVACSRIIRSHVLSFSALRQIRFGLGPEGDAAARALLAALALNGLVRSYAELVYRANCDLVEKSAPVATLDARYGNTEDVELPTIEEADLLLVAAADAAREAGVRWEGQVLEVVGNPKVAGGIEADSDSEA